MRILVANANRSIVGGIETYLRTILPKLHAAGHTLGLLTERPVIEGQGDVLACLPATDAWVVGESGPVAAIEAVAGWRPDVVYHHGFHDPAIDQALVARFAVVSYAHVYYGTCISGTKCHAIGPRPCNRVFGLACLALYLPLRCGGRSPITMLRSYGAHRQRLAAMRRCGAVLTASRHMRDEYARHGIREDSLHLVPLPLTSAPDLCPPTPRPASGRILFVGRLTELKGWHQLVEAMPHAAATLGRRLTLVVAGDGPDRQKFEAEAKRSGVTTEFVGWVGPEERVAQMRAADLLAVPSVWPEPFGLVGIEGGCVGLPSVGFAVGGIPDWLEPGVSGELAPGDPPTERGLTDALVRALCDEDRWNRLRVGAWEAARRFNVDDHMAGLLPILEAAAGTGRRDAEKAVVR